MRKCMLTLVVAAAVIAVATPAVAGPSSDQEIAEQVVLTIDDLPEGFRGVPPSEDDLEPTGRECRSLRRGSKLLDSAPNAEAQFRTESDTARIDNKVAVFKSVKGAKRAYAAYSAPDDSECFRRTYEQIFLEQLDDPDASVEVTIDEYEPDLGDAAVGYELEIGLEAQGESRTLYLDLEVSRVGRAVEAFAFFNTGSVPPSDDVVAMTEAGVERLEAAL